MPRLRVPETLRSRLKTPLGELIKGPPDNSVTRLKQILKSEKISKIICVGDFVSKLLAESCIPADLAIVDNKIMRQDAEASGFSSDYVFRATNPAGTLETAALAAVSEALDKPHSLLVVEGEEDLLALAAIALAPQDSLVLYGQPREGMIVVRVNRAKKLEIESILAQMVRE